jgi:hypothetical protein
MLNDPLVIILLCLAVSIGIFGVFSFTRTFGAAALRRLPFVGPPAPQNYFMRWMTSEQADVLRAAGIECAPHSVQNAQGYRVPGRALKPAIRALKARLVATFPTGQSGTSEAVLSFPEAAADQQLRGCDVRVLGDFAHSRILFWRPWLSRKRVTAILRETLVPLVRKPVVVYLHGARTSRPVDSDDLHFNVHVWSSPKGAVNRKPGEKLFGVPVAARSHGFVPSGAGVPIVETPSEYAVAELVGANNLYIHFDALATACDTELALLARIVEALREEMEVDAFLAQIVSSLPADGMPIGAAHASNFSIYEQNFVGRRRDVVKSLIKEILTPAVRADVFVKQCQGVPQEPLEDGMFHVFFQSAPLGTASINTPDRLFGYRVLKAETVFLPSGRGTPICDPSGFQIGELVGNNLYIYADLIHYASSRGAALLASLLMEVRRELVLVRAADRFPQEAELFAARLWQQVQSAGKADAATARKASTDLTALLKTARAAEQEMYRLEGTPGEAIGAEFDELLKIRKVVDVAVNDSWISVTTETLYCRDPRDGVLHEIGAFKIHIPTHSGTAIQWQNQTRRVSGPDGAKMNAPHVNSAGNACLGNTKDLFPQLISRREFATAVELAIAFVEAVNTNDNWGKYIKNWPVAVQ